MRKRVLICTGLLLVLVLLVALVYHLSFQAGLDPAKVSAFFGGAQALGTLLTAIAIVAAFFQVWEARKQLRDTRNWNRMSFALTFLPSLEMVEKWETTLETSIKLISRHEPLSNAELNKVESDLPTFMALKNFLNALETYCLAINRGVADEETARRHLKSKLTSHFSEMKPFIDHQRTKYKSDDIFGELEEVYKKWTKQVKPEVAKYGQEE